MGGWYKIVFKYLDLNNSQHMYCWTIKVVKLNSQKLTVKFTFRTKSNYVVFLKMVKMNWHYIVFRDKKGLYKVE